MKEEVEEGKVERGGKEGGKKGERRGKEGGKGERRGKEVEEGRQTEGGGAHRRAGLTIGP